MAKNNFSKEEVTPKNLYLNRRLFLKGSALTASALFTTFLYKYFQNRPNFKDKTYTQKKIEQDPSMQLTSYQDIAGYNNYYEFSTSKNDVITHSADWKISDWSISIEGLVENPYTLSLGELKKIKTEERIYRFRCVEGWSMVIPWQGFPLSEIIEKARPNSNAKFVAFETFYDESQMPRAKYAGIEFPYVEGLRLDEALHPLTILATGLYGEGLPNQNGAPVRLVVPWKYGFKSIKSLIKIRITDSEPPTTWNLANPQEYGFYSNVNPNVDHPRWSQKKERRIGEFGLRDTLLFNGYENEVAHMYNDLDLKKYF